MQIMHSCGHWPVLSQCMCVFIERQRHIKANDYAFNNSFRYEVSWSLSLSLSLSLSGVYMCLPICMCVLSIWGTGIRGLMRGMATLSQGYQELLVVRDKVGVLPGELGVSKSMECDNFPSVLWHCWLGDRKGIRPVKKLDVGLLVVMIWVELCTTYSSSSPVVATTSIILCFSKHQLTQVHLKNGR